MLVELCDINVFPKALKGISTFNFPIVANSEMSEKNNIHPSCSDNRAMASDISFYLSSGVYHHSESTKLERGTK